MTGGPPASPADKLDCSILFTWRDQKPRLLSKELVGTLSKQVHKGLLEKDQAWKRTGLSPSLESREE